MNLFVGNLDPVSNADGLRQLFSEFGEVVSSKVIMDNMTGMSKGFGFVEMGDRYQAQNAIDNLDMSYFEGRIISVKEAKQNNNQRSGGGRHGGGGGGYNGNRQFKPRYPRSGGHGERNFNTLD